MKRHLSFGSLCFLFERFIFRDHRFFLRNLWRKIFDHFLMQDQYIWSFNLLLICYSLNILCFFVYRAHFVGWLLIFCSLNYNIHVLFFNKKFYLSMKSLCLRNFKGIFWNENNLNETKDRCFTDDLRFKIIKLNQLIWFLFLNFRGINLSNDI